MLFVSRYTYTPFVNKYIAEIHLHNIIGPTRERSTRSKSTLFNLGEYLIDTMISKTHSESFSERLKLWFIYSSRFITLRNFNKIFKCLIIYSFEKILVSRLSFLNLFINYCEFLFFCTSCHCCDNVSDLCLSEDPNIFNFFDNFFDENNLVCIQSSVF